LRVANWENGGHVVLSPNGAYVISNIQHVLSGHHLKRGDFLLDGYRLESEPNALAIKSEYTLIAGGRGATSGGIEPIYVYELPITDRAFNATWAEPKLIHYLQGHPSRAQSLLLSPDEALLLSQARDRRNVSHHLWEIQTWQRLRTYETSREWVATRPDGEVLASGDRNGAATVWHLRTDEVLAVLPGKAPTVMSVDGRVLICRSNLGGLLVWDLATSQKICTLAEGMHEIEPPVLSRDRQFLVLRVEHNLQVWA
jgi:WD40 repeat protein